MPEPIKRPSGTRTQAAKAALLTALIAGGCLTAASSLAIAQPAPEDVAVLSGDGFETVRLPISPVEGQVRFSAKRAWVWNDTGRGDPTRRIVLDGDVRAVLGSYEFSATRASVWLQRVPGVGDSRVYQVYAVFDHVRTPAADAAIAIEADRLPVQGVINAISPVSLRVDVRYDGEPGEGDLAAFDQTARQTFGRRLAEITGLIAPDVEVVERPPALSPLPRHKEAPRLPPAETPGEAIASGTDSARRPTVVGGEPDKAPLFVAQGTFAVSVGDRIVVQRGERRNSALLSGGVTVQYSDPRSGDSLELSAQRGVVFMHPGALADQFERIDAKDVEGIYLEGEVLASNGTYTLRGPRVYYDVPSGRAVVLDAVFWTYDRKMEMPLYVRADSIRQQAAGTFVAKDARLANTAFHDPHFTIGATDVKVTVYDEDVNDDRLGGRSHVDARNLTVNAGSVPFLWFPRYMGDPEQFPLRNVQMSDSNRRGFGVQTTWNAYALLGLEAPPGIGADLQVDYFADSGFGLGLGVDWDRPGMKGDFVGYVVPNDAGKDVAPNGHDISRDGETRGFFHIRHRQEFGDRWVLRAEGGYISDELFMESYYPRLAERGPEITNRLHLARTTDDTQLTAQLKVQANDFIAEEWLLQAPGYFVDKLPEVGYVQVVRDLLPETAPGLLTHTWEASIGLMRMRFSEVDASAYGFTKNAQAMNAFGTTADTSLGDAMRALGLNEDTVGRFDTRQELSMQLRAGPVDITPFVVGRLTAYDTDFNDFSPNEGDSTRLWGAAGVKIATQIQRVNDSVESRLFDLHRTRHIIEPSLTLWHAGTNVDRVNLPVYDDGVENLAEGTIVRVGVDQTWQTKRGGPGRWRSVDVFKLNTEYVWSSGDADPKAPIGRFYDWRPELSNPGEYFDVDAVWQASEVVALTGQVIYDVDERDFERWSTGVLLQHSPRFYTGAELRSIDSLGATYGFLRAGYELTNKYTVDGRVTYNFNRDDVQAVSAEINRRFPNGTLGVVIVYDNIRGETSLGFNFRPSGLRSGGGGLGAGGASRFGG